MAPAKAVFGVLRKSQNEQMLQLISDAVWEPIVKQDLKFDC